MHVLGITTSTPKGGAAVFEASEHVGGRVAGHGEYVDLQGHAERIFAAIDAALAEAGIARRALGAVACDVGPGSFTGIRVGLATARGIALALGIPLIGVGSLEAMAEAAFVDGRASADDLVLASIDAKKNELFVALYDRALSPRIAPSIVARAPGALDVLLEELGPALASAPGVGRVLRIGEDAEPSASMPSAASIARLGAARVALAAGTPVEAVYVRAPDAKKLGA